MPTIDKPNVNPGVKRLEELINRPTESPKELADSGIWIGVKLDVEPVLMADAAAFMSFLDDVVSLAVQAAEKQYELDSGMIVAVVELESGSIVAKIKPVWAKLPEYAKVGIVTGAITLTGQLLYDGISNRLENQGAPIEQTTTNNIVVVVQTQIEGRTREYLSDLAKSRRPCSIEVSKGACYPVLRGDSLQDPPDKPGFI